MTEPMTDAEVKQAIERHCLTVSYSKFHAGTCCYVHGWRGKDGWVDFGIVKVKRFGDTVVVYVSGALAAQVYGQRPEWFPADEETTTEELDAAYAAHVAAKPVLVWDDDEHCSRSHHQDVTYLVTSTRTENDKRWFAHLVDRISQVTPLVGGFGYSKRDDAKAACERHARGE